MKPTKKMMAAVAAVYTYIRSEEDAAMQDVTGVQAEKTVSALPAAQKHWGLSARLDIMNWRGLMQMRTFRSRAVR